MKTWHKKIHSILCTMIWWILCLLLQVLPPLDCYLTCNGHILQEDEPFEDGKVYHIIPRLVGGKGGNLLCNLF